MSERPVRDQHGNPLPGTDEPLELRDDQVDEGLAALPGWERAGVVLKRAIPVPRDSRDALEEGVRNVVEDESRLEVQIVDDEFTIILGNGPGALVPADLETAARIDTVLSGSGTDHGTT
ncbi:hypothetical protein [Sporichthya sp.]|uniref:hypothetical protein n=1 Tax=Sporichthya sp. TaxID=65475 RepID=UPI0017CE678B|nr:hypothetical protein [Sporichthya sp.]MBA3741851.1 hypothetical protein [Sporichthya sp.]